LFFLFDPSPLPPPPQTAFEARAGAAASPEAAALLAEMRAHVAKLDAAARDEDPRLSFSTPEFKEAQRTFTDGFKVGRGRGGGGGGAPVYGALR